MSQSLPILFHQPLDVASRFARLVLAEYAVETALQVERVWEQRKAFLQLNPAATVPVLLMPDGLALVGSGPITGYLCEARADHGAPLLPAAAAGRAEVRRLVDWALILMEADVGATLVLEKALKRQIPPENGGGAPDTSAMRVARENLAWHLATINHLLSSRDWLAGERLTLADLAFAAALSSLDYLGEIAWVDQPLVKAWYARMKSRPSLAGILAERVSGVIPPVYYDDPDF